MTPNDSNLDPRSLRGTDSNSLLRLYDWAQRALSGSVTPRERSRADRAARRIAAELRSRDITV
jgi:hypothetical protein